MFVSGRGKIRVFFLMNHTVKKNVSSREGQETGGEDGTPPRDKVEVTN